MTTNLIKKKITGVEKINLAKNFSNFLFNWPKKIENNCRFLKIWYHQKNEAKKLKVVCVKVFIKKVLFKNDFLSFNFQGV